MHGEIKTKPAESLQITVGTIHKYVDEEREARRQIVFNIRCGLFTPIHLWFYFMGMLRKRSGVDIKANP